MSSSCLVAHAVFGSFVIFISWGHALCRWAHCIREEYRPMPPPWSGAVELYPFIPGQISCSTKQFLYQILDAVNDVVECIAVIKCMDEKR